MTTDPSLILVCVELFLACMEVVHWEAISLDFWMSKSVRKFQLFPRLFLMTSYKQKNWCLCLTLQLELQYAMRNLTILRNWVILNVEWFFYLELGSSMKLKSNVYLIHRHYANTANDDNLICTGEVPSVYEYCNKKLPEREWISFSLILYSYINCLHDFPVRLIEREWVDAWKWRN